MSLSQIVRLESNGLYREALEALRELRRDPETDLPLVVALRPYEMHLERLVPADPEPAFNWQPAVKYWPWAAGGLAVSALWWWANYGGPR